MPAGIMSMERATRFSGDGAKNCAIGTHRFVALTRGGTSGSVTWDKV
jgi:hypothetical protein